MRLLLTVAVMAGVVLGAGDAAAQCATSTFLEVAVGDVTLYLEDGPGGTWIYMESNDVEGLQRGGRNIVERATGIDLGPVFHDACLEGDENGDLLIGKSCAALEGPYGIDVPTCLSY